jgi:hypothetical protein
VLVASANGILERARHPTLRFFIAGDVSAGKRKVDYL